MKQKHLVSERDWTRQDIEEVFDLARKMKAEPAAYRRALEGRSLAMIFQKPSTRTRVSFEVGMAQLGGTALYLGAGDIQLGRGETVPDTARVLSRYVDGIMARVFAQEDLVELAKHATVPVINGLSDLLHPCQALADYFTLLERRGLEGMKLAYVGDGNNMCHSLLLVGVKLGVAVAVAAPAGYEPNALILKSAAREAQKAKAPGAGGGVRPPAGGQGSGRRLHRRVDLDGPGSGDGEAPPRLPGLHGLAGHDEGGRAAGRVHALPARAPRRGGRGGGHRRPPVGGLRRSREPPPRAEGDHGLADGTEGLATEARRHGGKLFLRASVTPWQFRGRSAR